MHAPTARTTSPLRTLASIDFLQLTHLSNLSIFCNVFTAKLNYLGTHCLLVFNGYTIFYVFLDTLCYVAMQWHLKNILLLVGT